MIRALRMIFLALAIVLGVGGFTISAIIFAVGSVLLHPFDTDEQEVV